MTQIAGQSDAQQSQGGTARHGDPAAYSPWLHRYAIALVLATFVLVASGGNVTSRDAGLSVPDGFTVYGHFLWTFPVEQWVGNIFHEHVHRLKGSVVGLMCIGMTIALWRAGRGRRWLRMTGLLLLLLVLIQGAMGGLRVEFVNHFPSLATPFAVLHGVLGQLFLCLTVLVAAATSRYWAGRHSGDQEEAGRRNVDRSAYVPRTTRRLCLVMLAAMVIQLVLGAAMRHTQSGLAIPDFPASYGRLFPPMSPKALEAALNDIPYDEFTGTYNIGQVHLHFGHRLWAVVVIAAVVAMLGRLGKAVGDEPLLRGPAIAMILMLITQVLLGALVIWTRRIPDVATAHQALGAALLATSALLTIRVFLLTRVSRVPAGVPKGVMVIGGVSA